MKLWITVALIALMTASAYPREAKAYITVATLLGLCTALEVESNVPETKKNYKLGICNGFIRGVIEGWKASANALNSAPNFFVPDSRAPAMRQVVMEYINSLIDNGRDIQDDHAVDLIMNTFRVTEETMMKHMEEHMEEQAVSDDNTSDQNLLTEQ